jgi:hypothetical protein
MSGKSGPGVPKNLRKVTPGYDQAFTLPKGTSAAPIKQVKPKKNVVVDKFIKRYEDKDVGPALQISKDLMVGLPATAIVAAISDKRNYKNKTKPKKEKYNPRLQGNRNDKRP